MTDRSGRIAADSSRPLPAALRGQYGPRYQRVATRLSTESRGSSCPSRSQPFHSHALHIVNEAGEPARFIVTWIVSCEPHAGQVMDEWVTWAIAIALFLRSPPASSVFRPHFASPTRDGTWAVRGI